MAKVTSLFGGSLPVKMKDPAGLEALYHLMKCEQVTHETVLAPHRELTFRKIAGYDGTKTLPAERRVVDVCDRGADTFEFLEHETGSGRTFVIRSSHNRSILTSHAANAEKSLLHDFACGQLSLGQWTLEVPAARQEKTSKKTGKKTVTNRKKRDAVMHVSAAAVQVRPPSTKRGNHGDDPLPLWIVRVWEPQPPEGVEALKWFLLTNDPCEAFESAYEVVSWYEYRWIIEVYQPECPSSAILYQLAA